MSMTARIRHLNPLYLVLLLGATPLATPVDVAAQAIYRCERDGRVTYTDAPCDQPVIRHGTAAGGNAPPNNTQTVIGGGYQNPYGPWRGQAQFQLTHIGARSDTIHQVVHLVLEIAEDGKVAGTSRENGCDMLGIATPGATPRILNLDVTLSRCSAKDLNRRYRGTILLNPADRSAHLSLNAQRVIPGMSLVADIKAALRR